MNNPTNEPSKELSKGEDASVFASITEDEQLILEVENHENLSSNDASDEEVPSFSYDYRGKQEPEASGCKTTTNGATRPKPKPGDVIDPLVKKAKDEKINAAKKGGKGK